MGAAMSIVDRREIRFGEDAVRAAVAASPEAAATLGLPAIPPDAVRFLPAEHRIELLYGVGSGMADFPVSAESLGALLVGYCCRHRIALPRGARKAIRIGRDAAVLAFELSVPPVRRPQPAMPSPRGTR